MRATLRKRGRRWYLYWGTPTEEAGGSGTPVPEAWMVIIFRFL